MPPHLTLAMASMIVLAGCTHPPPAAKSIDPLVAASARSPAATSRSQPPPARGGLRQPDRTVDTSDPIAMDSFEVRESAFSDFGMSIRTNFEVRAGGRITWIEVSGVNPGSSAAAAGLTRGDRILAIEGRVVTEMNRDEMLDRLFQRRNGERTQILIFGQDESLPHFITLTASRPDSP